MPKREGVMSLLAVIRTLIESGEAELVVLWEPWPERLLVFETLWLDMERREA